METVFLENAFNRTRFNELWCGKQQKADGNLISIGFLLKTESIQARSALAMIWGRSKVRIVADLRSRVVGVGISTFSTDIG